MKEVVDLDDSEDNADWTKQTWDLPPYGSYEFFQIVPLDELDEFRKRPVYLNAVAQGLIHDDEWVQDYVEDPKTPNLADKPQGRKVRYCTPTPTNFTAMAQAPEKTHPARSRVSDPLLANCLREQLEDLVRQGGKVVAVRLPPKSNQAEVRNPKSSADKS